MQKISDSNTQSNFGLNIKLYPKEVRYILLRKCNHLCTYCHYERASEENNEIPYNILEREIKNNKKNIDIVHLTGGEPLLYSSFNKLIDYLNKNKFTSHVTTNGSLIHTKLKQLKKITDVHVSLPSLNERNYKKITRTNNLEQVLENLCYKKINFEINFLPIKSIHNVLELPKYIGFCKLNGIKSINILEMESNSNDLVSYNAVRDLLKKNFGKLHEETIIRHNHPVDRIKIDGINIHLCDIAMYPNKICSNCNMINTCNEGIYHPRMFYANNKVVYQICGIRKKFSSYLEMQKEYSGNFFYRRRI